MKGQGSLKTRQPQPEAVTFRSVSEALGALMKSDSASFAWLIIDGFDKLATLDPQGFNGLVSAIVTRKLRAGNFFIALEQLRAHLQQQDCEAAEERASAIKAWLGDLERLGTLLAEAQQQRAEQSATTYLM
jgi:hypothetical protein